MTDDAFDTSALERRPSAEEVEQFRRSRVRAAAPAGGRLTVFVPAAVTGVLFSVLALLSGEPWRWTLTVLVVVWVVCTGATATVLLLARLLSDRLDDQPDWERRLQLHRFALANGMHYASDSGEPPYRGVVFGAGARGKVVDRLWSEDGPLRDCGVYEYTAGTRGLDETVRWHFVAVRLPGPLPRLLLDARANDALSSSTLPEGLEGTSLLSLGSPFDDHFRLYCAEQHRADAFFVLTPDVMALLIDRAQTLDLEVVDGWLLLYSRYPHGLTDPAWWQRIGQVVDTVGARISDRAASRTRTSVGALPTAADLHGPDGPPPAVPPPRTGRALRWAAIGVWVVLLGFAAVLLVVTGRLG